MSNSRIMKFFPIILILLIIFCISTVNATDYSTDNDLSASIDKVDTTQINTKTLVDEEDVSLDKVYVSTRGKDTNNGSKSNPKATIKSALSVVKEGGSIYLNSGTYCESRIVLDKNVSISGYSKQLTVINSSDKNTFTVKSNAVLKALTITNAGNEKGGALYNAGNLTLKSIKIQNSTASSCGGAIYNVGKITASNSSFENNQARFGASIYNTGSITIVDSTFTSNIAAKAGSAIYSTGTITIKNSQFTHNYNTAVYICPNNNQNVIRDSIFTDNEAVSGSSIYNRQSELTVVDTVFKENSATKYGMIYNSGLMSIKCSLFRQNVARFGGCVYNVGNLTVGGTVFTYNGASKAGSAVYSKGKLAVEDSNLTKNDNTVVYICPNDNHNSIDNVNFIANTGVNGACIYNRQSELTVVDSVFKENSATKYGIIYTSGSLSIKGSLFRQNVARFGGCVYNVGNLTVLGTIFTYNGASKAGSAVYSKGKLAVEDSNFTKNSNAAVYICPNTNYNSISDAFFASNEAINGASIYNRQSELAVIDSVFKENCATKYGAIYNSGLLTVKGSLFKRNVARFGASIYNVLDLTIINTVFTSNNADKTGSAVYSKDKLSVESSNFTNNTDVAIYICPNSNHNSISDARFTDNEADNGAGIYNRQSQLTVKDSHFTLNSATKGAGICNTGKLTLTNNTFSSNKASITGSAVFSTGRVILNNSRFNNNTVEQIVISKKQRQNTKIIANSFTSTANSTVVPVIVKTTDDLSVVDGNVTLYINNNFFKTQQLSNSETRFNLETLTSGTYSVRLEYYSNIYNKSTATINVKVLSTATININPATYNYGERIEIPYNIVDSKNNEVNAGTVTVTMDNAIVFTGNYNQNSRISLTGISGGTHDITVKYNSDSYLNTTKTTTLQVNKVESNIFVDDLQKKISQEVYIPVTVTDSLNNSITSGTLNAYYNNISKASAIVTSQTTYLKINGLGIGSHMLNIEYTSNNYLTSSKNIMLTINPDNNYSIRLIYNPAIEIGTKTKIRGLVKNSQLGTINSGIVRFYYNNQYVGTESTKNNLSSVTVTPSKIGYQVFKVDYYNSNNQFIASDTRLIYVRRGQVQSSQDTFVTLTGDLISNSGITSSKKDVYFAMDRTTGDTNYSPNDMKIMNNIAVNLEANGFNVKRITSGPGETYEIARYMYKNKIRNSICFILCNGVDANVIRQYFKGNDNMLTTVRNRGNDIVMGWFYGAGDIYNPDGEYYYYLPKAWDDNYSKKGGMATPRKAMENNGIKIVYNKYDLTGQDIANSFVKLYGGKITDSVKKGSTLSLKTYIRTSNNVNGNLVYKLNGKVIRNMTVSSKIVYNYYTAPNVAGTYNLKVEYYANNKLKCTTFDRYIKVTD